MSALTPHLHLLMPEAVWMDDGEVVPLPALVRIVSTRFLETVPTRG
jgi:hypothetical protein